MDFKDIVSTVFSREKAPDLSLSAESMNTLDELILKGIFNDKSDFMRFIVKTYWQYKIRGSAPTSSNILDIINQAGIDKNFSDADIMGRIFPLMVDAFKETEKKKTS
ncbi:hypothetical protein CUJ83_12185 [Methanocella sp. CWC-04]|uniref:Uncharacterized protein n=1 Tax=Methanooceanicella nereidis TaxID=2052831 RepID=A0AAP2REA6_9EURY|nr:hypothetical protein [Methanocella sp. CWC-04]MCD1295758.1 hypothetical protein [Methanocella sp. CWC-04]